MKKIKIVNTGLSYDICREAGYVLCSCPTKRLAEVRANELCFEFGVVLSD